MAEETRWTVNSILNWTQQYFGRRGVDTPRLDAEILLCDILGCKCHHRQDGEPAICQL